MGKQRLLGAAEEPVEEGEQVGTLGRECGGAVDGPDQSTDARRGVRSGQPRGEEDEIAEREMLSTFDVDGVVRPARPMPEACAVRIGREARLAAHEHERPRQTSSTGSAEQDAVEIGAGVDTGIDEHRRGRRRPTERMPEHPDMPEVETTREDP